MNCTKNNLEARPIKRVHYLMNTFFGIEIFHDEEERAKAVLQAAFDEARRVESVLSRFREDSQVCRMNRFAGIRPQVIDEELFSLIKECVRFSEITTGAFDITIASLADLWRRAEKLNSLPETEEIDSLMKDAGYENIILDSSARAVSFKTPALKLDLGAVGKGYALDRVVEILKREGVERARMDFGGQLYYFDSVDSGSEYVGIRDPFHPDEILRRVALINRSIATSANYERGLKIEGKTYSHIIDPRNGRPVDNNILSASVISGSALSADMLSTAIIVIGKEAGLRLAKGMGEEAIIVTNDRQ